KVISFTGSVRSILAGIFAKAVVDVWGPALSTVPAKTILARRESSFHCGPRTRSAKASSDCAAAKADKMQMAQASAASNNRRDARMASLFPGGNGTGRVLGVESA